MAVQPRNPFPLAQSIAEHEAAQLPKPVEAHQEDEECPEGYCRHCWDDGVQVLANHKDSDLCDSCAGDAFSRQCEAGLR